MNRLFNGDCINILVTRPYDYDCIFADPPDNLGLNYDQYSDNLPLQEYRTRLGQWLRVFTAKAPIVWISFNPMWTIDFGAVVWFFLENNPDWEWKQFVQTFTFGQNNKRDCGVGHRPLWRFKRKDAPLYPDQIKVPSWRELNGDKRAAPGGRVPLDVWDFPRVVGNSKQRRGWHPTQLNEGLVERAIKLSTEEGGLVCDPFAGTGTTLRVCKQINRECHLIDVDRGYCENIAEEHNLVIEDGSKG